MHGRKQEETSGLVPAGCPSQSEQARVVGHAAKQTLVQRGGGTRALSVPDNVFREAFERLFFGITACAQDPFL